MSNLIALHVGSLLLTAIVIIYSDHQGYVYWRGKKPVLNQTLIHWLHRLVWGGLLAMIVTGGLLVWPAWEYYLTLPAWYLKMSFVLVLLFNGYVIGQVSKVATERPFAELSPSERRMLMVSGTLSATSWIGAAIIGMFFLA